MRSIEIVRNENGGFDVQIDMVNGERRFGDRLNNEEALGEAARCLFGTGPHYAVNLESLVAREIARLEREKKAEARNE